jgi:hypothetical protein
LKLIINDATTFDLCQAYNTRQQYRLAYRHSASHGKYGENFTDVVQFLKEKKKKNHGTPKLINSFCGTMFMMESESLTPFVFITGNINMTDVLNTSKKKYSINPLSFSCLNSCLVTHKKKIILLNPR